MGGLRTIPWFAWKNASPVPRRLVVRGKKGEIEGVKRDLERKAKEGQEAGTGEGAGEGGGRSWRRTSVRSSKEG